MAVLLCGIAMLSLGTREVLVRHQFGVAATSFGHSHSQRSWFYPCAEFEEFSTCLILK